MTSNFHKVYDFHNAFTQSQLTPNEALHNFDICSLRVHLIDEEFNEYLSAQTQLDQMDALADLLYVIYGAGVIFGIDLDHAYTSYLHEFGTFLTDSNWKILTHFEQTQRLMIESERSLQHLIPSIDPFDGLLRELSYGLLMCNTNDVGRCLVRMLYHVYHLGFLSRFRMDCLFDLVHQSNMTKLCTTKQEAEKTVQWYQEHMKDRYPQPMIGRSPDGIHWVVFDQSSGGKILKSISYQPPKIVVEECLIP